MMGNFQVVIQIAKLSVFFRGPNYYDVSRDEFLPAVFRAAWGHKRLFSLGEVKPSWRDKSKAEQ